MKIKKELILALILLVSVFLAAAFCKTENNDKEKVNSDNEINEAFSQEVNDNREYESSKQSISDKGEDILKGVWISYISLASNSESEFKENYYNLILKAKNEGITDLFVHVRPFMDALYKSEIFPVSYLVTGKEGDEISFDPLEFMITAAHELGMKFHAWINPLRIKTSGTPKALSENSIYNKYIESDPYFFIETEDITILNPAYSFVRELVSEGIREIVLNYNVDGIHFDDYFYPENYDAEKDGAYINYRDNTERPLNSKEWMQANINSLISICYQAAKTGGKDVAFGVSPQGNMENNLKIGANTKLWCEQKGYIDYVCPQLYWSYDNPSLGFSEALSGWMNIKRHKELKVYVGLALYKVNTESDSNTWGEGSKIIYKQEKDAVNSGAQGYVLYEISHFDKLH